MLACCTLTATLFQPRCANSGRSTAACTCAVKGTKATRSGARIPGLHTSRVPGDRTSCTRRVLHILACMPGIHDLACAMEAEARHFSSNDSKMLDSGARSSRSTACLISSKGAVSLSSWKDLNLACGNRES